MLKIIFKILRTSKTILPADPLDREQTEIIAIGEKIHIAVKRQFQGALAIRHVDAGSDNACEQELAALTNAVYDIERFGIQFVASPKHADMLLVTGPMTQNMAAAVRSAYAATPDPKIVVSVGDDALDGGIYKGSYAVLDGVGSVIPVHYHIPGNPPSPKTILYHLLQILETHDG